MLLYFLVIKYQNLLTHFKIKVFKLYTNSEKFPYLPAHSNSVLSPVINTDINLLCIHPEIFKCFMYLYCTQWNVKVGSQETPGVTGKFGLGVHNEGRQRLTEFFQENALVIANSLFQEYKRRLHVDITRWPIPKSG